MAGLAVATTAGSLRADPLRLRADALLQTRSPVGLLVLRGEDRVRPWVDAETVAWLGVTDRPEATGDVLTLSVRLRDPRGLGEVRVGRLLVSMGAVRPVHLDGARSLVRAPWGTTVEAFGGFPVAPRFDYRGFGWAAGGRVGQSVGDWLVMGASYIQQRTDDRRTNEEVGMDLALTPASAPITAAARVAFDLVTPGVTDALLSASGHLDATRIEMFATYRSPGRMLPSTSLFSVLGDFPSTTTGATVRVRAAPRLELVASGATQFQGDVVGGYGFGRVSLALDDDGEGSLGLEARRVYFGASRWIGARVLLTVPLPLRLRVATELELVRPDDPRGRGDVWPWMLAALSYRSKGPWEVAAAVESAAGPEYRSEVHALARFSYNLERLP